MVVLRNGNEKDDCWRGQDTSQSSGSFFQGIRDERSMPNVTTATYLISDRSSKIWNIQEGALSSRRPGVSSPVSEKRGEDIV